MADINAGMDTTEFDKHFAELSKLGDASDTAKSEPVAETPVETAPAVEQPAETVTEEQPAEGAEHAETPPADDAEVGGEPPAPVENEGAGEKPAVSEDTLKRFTEYMERQEAERQRAEDARAQQSEQAPQDQPEQPWTPQVTQQEIETLQTFEKDWPEAADAMKIAMRVNTEAAVQSVFKTLEQYLAPKMHLLDLMANRMQYRELREDFPQYNEDYREQLKAWALSDEHPAYLRAAHEHVITNGSQQDVADLIERYEQARGSRATTQQATPKPRKTPELPTTTIQAARSMAPVSGKRSNPTVQVTPSSFEDAFDQFAKEVD